MKCRFVSLLISALSIAGMVPAHSQIVLDWVTVGDPGNTAETVSANSLGDVATEYQIMKYEFTNSNYVAFLNAVDPTGSNTLSLYNANMHSQRQGGISLVAGNPDGSKYVTKTNMGSKPVNYVSWFDAARVANYLMTGGTENGAYTLNSSTPSNAPALNAGASVFIPSVDQWVKAGFYKGGSTDAGYWQYATQENGDPTGTAATTTGDGTAGTSGNFGNFDSKAKWPSSDANVTTVGTNGAPSAYGTFDISGNVYEWNDLDATAAVQKGIRGGDYSGNKNGLRMQVGALRNATDEDYWIGFRLASIPEPSVADLLTPLGVLSALAWFVGQRLRAAINHVG